MFPATREAGTEEQKSNGPATGANRHQGGGGRDGGTRGDAGGGCGGGEAGGWKGVSSVEYQPTGGMVLEFHNYEVCTQFGVWHHHSPPTLAVWRRGWHQRGGGTAIILRNEESLSALPFPDFRTLGLLFGGVPDLYEDLSGNGASPTSSCVALSM